MRAIILAGGPAGQEAGVPRKDPRALWPVLMRPIVVALIQRLTRNGVTAASVCANGRTEVYANRLAQRELQLDELRFSEDALPRGPAGCVKDNESFLADTPFIIANAACWLSDDVSSLLDQHCRHGNQLTVLCRPNSRIPSGIYICDPSVLEHIPGVGYCDIKEQLIPRLHRCHCRVEAMVLQGFTNEVVNPQTYLETHHRALHAAAERGENDELASYEQLSSGIWVAPDAWIAGSARVFGPVTVGSEAILKNGSVVIGPTTIGPGAVVGENAMVSECAVWANARIPPRSTLDRAIVTDSAV